MRIGSRTIDGKDVTTALIFIVVSVISLFEGIRLSLNPPAFRMNQVLKPGWYLILIAVLLLASGVGYLVTLIVKAPKTAPDAVDDAGTGDEDVAPPVRNGLMSRLLWLIAALVGYGVLIAVLGYVLATPIFFLSASIIFGVRKILPLVIMTVGLSAVLVFVFIYLLRVRMPTGLFDLFNI
ncbi:tripartite tricarboxylate transporter TctB family protein [Microbacterium soli]|uniref:DUF1468 domain-containing protein n=1 Tax=Microbacterium soli TaxID=446075 RepID=A0ABP7NCI9_9MICO